MAGISSGGIGSGLDVATIVQQLVAADRAAPDARFDRTERQINARISAVGTLRGAFAALRTAVSTLSSKDAAQARKVALPDAANFSATATAGAAIGRYQVEVLALATAQKLGSGAYAGSDTRLGTGTLTIAAGDTSLAVTIDEGHATLAGIRDAINAAAGGKTVAASIVTGDDGAHLVLNALSTGTTHALTIASSGGDGGLSVLDYAPAASGGWSQLVAAADAQVRIDGFQRTSASNTLTDVISGVSLTLTKAEPGTVRELAINGDSSVQRNAAKGFVSAYNAALSAIASTTTYNSSTNVAAALNGDSMVRGAARELRDAVSANVSDLKAVGITINKDGTLKLDEAAFDAAVARDPAPAVRLFGAGGETLVGKLDGSLDRLLDDDGLLDGRSDGLEKRTRDLRKQRDALDFRMTQVEARYRAQFTALDSLVTSLQSTSNFLSQQLSAL